MHRMSWDASRDMGWYIKDPMSPRAIPRYSMHGSRGRLKPWLIAFNFERFKAVSGPVIFFAENLPMGVAQLKMHPGRLAPYELLQNASKLLIYCFVVQPRNDSETVVKVVLMSVQSRGSR